nr:melanoma-associated antigen B4-like [Ovis aries]
MCMTGSDIFLNTLECGAIFESCCGWCPRCLHAHLQSVTSVIMPWRHNSKYHACVKRYQVRRDTQCPQEAQASAAAAAEECPSFPFSGPQGSDEGAQGPEEESAGASQAAPATQSTRKDPLARKASMLVEFLLEKDTKKEPIMQNALLTVINRKYRQHFSEILRRASERMELVFGLELKEVNHSRNIYVLISKLSLGGDEGPNDEKGCPSLVSPWKHPIFGEPRRLITKDLVQKKSLKYLQVPNSDPLCYEFLWGPRACAETSKMKVLEVLAKIHDMVLSSFQDLYDEALRDQAERAGLRGATQDPAMAEASAPSRAKSCSSSHI